LSLWLAVRLPSSQEMSAVSWVTWMPATPSYHAEVYPDATELAARA
jgi:hypothetical protein